MIQEIQENLDRTQESQDTTNTNTEELRNTQESVNLNLKDYEEYRVYKAEKEKEHINKNLSINERISRELAEAQAREEQEQKLLLEATRINEIDNLARKHLSSHFNKESLLSKGYSLKDIMQAQRRELVRKYVPIDDIYAISKVRDTQHLDGKVLEQLVNLAKVNIKKRIQATTITSKGDVKFSLSNEVLSILDPNLLHITLMSLISLLLMLTSQYENSFITLKLKKALRE